MFTQKNEQTNEQKQRSFTIMTISVPIPYSKKTGFKSSITSIFYSNNFKINTKEFIQRMKILNLSKIKIILVFGNNEHFPEKRLYNYDSSLYLIFFSYNEFFTISNIEYFFNDEKENTYEHFFVFENQNWHEICGRFATVSIDISGGSNNKKHLLSPLNHKLSQFLICLYGGGSSSNEVNNSFHKELGFIGKKIINYSDIKNQNHIIDFTKSNEIFKKRLLDDSFVNSLESKEFKNIDSEKEVDEVDEKEKKNGVYLGKSNTKFSRSFHSSCCNHSIIEIKDPEVFNREVEEVINNKNNSNNSQKIKNYTLSFYLEKIKEIIDNSVNLSDIEKRKNQLKIERIWIDLITEKIKNEKYFLNNYQGMLLSSLNSAKDTLNIMEKDNYFQKKFPKLGNSLNKIEFIIIAFTICISFYTRFSYNSIAIRVGDQILNYLYYQVYIKNLNKSEKVTLLTKQQFINNLGFFTAIDSLKLGDFFMSILQQFPHEIFSRKIKLDSYFTNEPYFLEINKIFINDIKENIIIDTSILPMISKPNIWVNNKFGGKLSNEFLREDIITGLDKINHIVENKVALKETCNYLNSIEFSVNNKMLDYIFSEEGSFLLNEIKAEDELQRVFTLEVAKLFYNSKFYLNTFGDWRGRIYTQSFYLSYQAGDLAVSLLNFSEGMAINDEGKFYLYIHGANSHNENGISKKSFEERIAWVKNNYEKIINLDKELILIAENPFTFTAFCLNMIEIHNNPLAIIKTPVFLDATCSGIQHLAGLMKDVELGSYTNLLPSNNNDLPKDIYNHLVNIINTVINKYGKENNEYEALSFIKLSRKHIKAPVMTKIYNVTVYGISKQLQAILKGNNTFLEKAHENAIEEISNELEDSIINKNKNKKNIKFSCPTHDGDEIKLSRKEIYKMAELINEQIFVVFPSLNFIYNYFIEVTKLISRLGIALYWITPSGMKITQHYLKQKKKIVSISIFGKTKKIVIKENTDKLNKVKQAQAIIPNIIHSLDATHLMYIIKSVDKENFKPLISVHDCFGTLPNLMGALEHKVKKEFIILYSQSKFLDNFHQRFIQNITDNQFEIISKNDKEYVILENKLLEIPAKPKLGDLDLDNIINSKYMIS